MDEFFSKSLSIELVYTILDGIDHAHTDKGRNTLIKSQTIKEIQFIEALWDKNYVCKQNIEMKYRTSDH